jgi:hypothetical protein
MKKLMYLVCILVAMSGCEKELSLEGATTIPPTPPVTEPERADSAPVFQLKSFYSDIAIDFDESDGDATTETDLWKYVLDYVKDDYHVLRNDSTVEVIQNDIKMPGLGDEVLQRSYSRGEDDLGSYLMYLTPDYRQMKYRLDEWTGDHFVISLKWKDGARVFSRFERIR